MNKVMIDGGKIVGMVLNGTFYKTIKGSKHFLISPPAIAFDVSSLERAERLGAIKIEVTNKETGKKYYSSIKNIKTYGQQFNRGHGEQIFLPMYRWSMTPDNQDKLL